MRLLALPLTIGAAMFVVSLDVSPARAVTMFHTWVASFGVDNSTCGDRASPCATFLGAITNTNAGGEITCADSGNFGGVTINKTITIDCGNANGSNMQFFGIDILTSASDVVVLRGLDIQGGLFSSGANIGLINFLTAGVLRLDKVKVSNLRGNGSGIRFTPSGAARLDVSNSFVADNGTSVSTAGILIKPQSGGSANVAIDGVRLLGNANGIFVDGSGGGGPVNLSVRDSLVTGSSNVGIVVATSGPSLTALIDRTTITSSLNVGVAVSGAAATVRIANSTIYGNVTGVAAFGGGSLRSYKNNQISGNLTDGTPIAAEGLN